MADTGTAAQPQAGPAAHNARNAAELPHNAKAAVGRTIEVDMEGLRRMEWNPVTTIGPRKTNDDSIKQFSDAGQGNLVIMDMSEHNENITEAERIDIVGDWDATRSVGKIRSHKDLKDPDESKRQLKLVSYEPWVPDRSGNPEIPPLWLAVDIARIESRPVPNTSWEVAQTIPWRHVAALPMRTYDRYYRHLGGVASSSFTINSMGTSAPAVSLLGKTFGGSEKYIELKTFLTAFQNNDPGKIEAARKMRLAQAYLSKGRKRVRELAEMNIDSTAQVARLHCADLFDLDYHHN
eukprot:jgi/Tetstr1/429750/TSEL_001927.t1